MSALAVQLTNAGSNDINGIYPFVTLSGEGGGGVWGPNPGNYYIFYVSGEWVILPSYWTDGNGGWFGPPYYYAFGDAPTDPTTGEVINMYWYNYYGNAPGPTVAWYTPNPPNVPTSVTITNGIGVSIVWTAPTADSSYGAAATYNVYRSNTEGGTYTAINGSPITTTSYCDVTGTFGQTYYYSITAVNTVGESTKSSPQAGIYNSSKGTLKSSGVGNLLTDLLGYYTSLSANLLQIFDYTSASNDMAAVGTTSPVFGTDASGDQTLNFNGTCYAGCESPTNLSGYPVGNGFTVAWRGTPTAVIQSYYVELFQGLGCYLRWSNPNQDITFYMTPNSGQWSIGNISNNPYVNTEHVYALTYNPTTGYGRAYVDGNLFAIIHQTGTINTDGQAYFHLNSGSTAGHYMQAKWKELALWGRELTYNEIKAFSNQRWCLATDYPNPVFASCSIPTGGLQLFAESLSLSQGDSSNVMMIPDQSPSANDIVQANGSYQPRFALNVYKTDPCVRFTTGQTYWMNLSSAITLPGAFTEILVFKNPSNGFFFANTSTSDLLPVPFASDYSMIIVSRDGSGNYTVTLNGVDITETAGISTNSSSIIINNIAYSGG